MQLTGCYISEITEKPRGIHLRYQALSYSHGDQTLDQTINVILRNGNSSLVNRGLILRPSVNRVST